LNRYLFRRLLQVGPQLLILVVISFALVHLTPGMTGVIDLESPSAQNLLATREMLGLDRPLLVQFVEWFGRMLSLDFGYSLIDGQPVLDKIMRYLPPTLLLTGSALVLSVLIALPLGVLASLYRNSWTDYGLTVFAFLGISIPSFWAAIILIIVFGVWLGWLPTGGMRTVGGNAPHQIIDTLRHLVLPASVLGLDATAALMRFVRSSMTEVLVEDYVRTARSKGLNPLEVVFRHALKNALIPAVTLIGLRLPLLVGGAVLIEIVFAWPGIGRLGYEAVIRRDFPVVMALVVFTGVVTIIGNLLADLSYGLLDPRVNVEA
jgi:peptide/nickel transport system permease protein